MTEMETFYVAMKKGDNLLFLVAGPFFLWSEADEGRSKYENENTVSKSCHLVIVRTAINCTEA